MKGYVSFYKTGDRQIFVNINKFRIYARLHGFISEGFFHQGESALDSVFALLASFNPSHIDYILDIRFCEEFPRDIFQLWKKKALETLAGYPQLYLVSITNKDSPLWLQISEWKELFEKHGDRIFGTFETLEKAEAFLDGGAVRKPALSPMTGSILTPPPPETSS
jgi:hypothetical protein